ncbi:MAG TPA: ubiquitin-like small modifier protein 1 [Thermodesulfobacteriota bacterium]|nr:ubiquitin-like small modifier protein 1 [Thermodesulfobacteriota bacterium]
MAGEVTVQIPVPLRPWVEGRAEVTLPPGTAGEVLRALTERYPELRRHLFTEEGRLRNFVNVFVDDENIHDRQGLETPVAAGQSLALVPAIAGGAVDLAAAARAQGAREEPARLTLARDPETVELSQAEILRYSRHLIMPEVAMRGQKRLKAARVLLIGAGGLGSPLALYLAAAGVGRIGLVDFDVVDFTNLQRQVLHGTKDVGRPKLASARDRIADINPEVELVTYETALSSANALEILRDYDVVVDGTDNFPTRYLVNDACVLLGKPNVYGSIFRFDGQATVFWAGHGPCYRCLYPEPPPPGLVPSCAEGGVLGILPGLVGLVQATETIKLILGQGEPLLGRLLLVDALRMRFRELKIRANPDCPICGPKPTIRELIDYEAFCGVGAPAPAHDGDGGIPTITPAELKARLDRGEPIVLLDVRQPVEWEISRLPGAKLLPLPELPARVHELSSADEIVAFCRTGQRSAQAVEFLRTAGFRKVANLAGGINRWAAEIDPSVPQY